MSSFQTPHSTCDPWRTGEILLRCSSVYGKGCWNRNGLSALSGGAYCTAMGTERPSSFLKLAQNATLMSVVKSSPETRKTGGASGAEGMGLWAVLLTPCSRSTRCCTNTASRRYGCSYIVIEPPVGLLSQCGATRLHS